VTLSEIGFTPRVEASFEPHAARGLAPGRIAFRDRDRCRVFTGSGEEPAVVAGRLFHESAPEDLPAVGDWVALRLAHGSEAVVEAVLPRRTRFGRRAAGRREDRQIVAANIDVVFLVCGLDHDFNLRRLERYLTLAWESGADPVVVLNKADLCPEIEERVAEARSVAGAAPVVTTAAAGGELDALRAWIGIGRTVALIGSSGVGKSTIVNALLGEELLRTAPIRESDGRGRHTTTFRELIPLPEGGALIDTPGMRELQLWASEESVGQAFEGVQEIARACRFRDCAHGVEAGCAVRAALEEGSLDAARWESYRKLLGEARHHEMASDTHARQVHKQRWKRISKSIREHYRIRERE
jgi:ribosome biogenesis GTPase / thiamine phosphate phosphatase